MRAWWRCLRIGLCGLAAFTCGNLNMAYLPVDVAVTWPLGCRRWGRKGRVSSRAQPAVSNRDFILDQLTFDSLYWLRYSITVNHILIVELWSSCRKAAKARSRSRKALAGQPDCHACSTEDWKVEKFVTKLFDFTPRWQDAACQSVGWSYEPLSNQISVKWDQIDMEGKQKSTRKHRLKSLKDATDLRASRFITLWNPNAMVWQAYFSRIQ